MAAKSARIVIATQIETLEEQIRTRKRETEDTVAELERKHKAQIATIGKRVKQTVAKRDQMIATLQEKVKECGLRTGDILKIGIRAIYAGMEETSSGKRGRPKLARSERYGNGHREPDWMSCDQSIL
jgi:enoyl-[acyl-carrier-protein] reductase (NADH)